MDLIDRYVQSVRFFLPAAQRDDIGRELAADIRSEVQDKEAELGRPLAADEISAILKRWGHPVIAFLVAMFEDGRRLYRLATKQ